MKMWAWRLIIRLHSRRSCASRWEIPLALEAQCLQLPDGVAADPDQEARRYAAALEAAGGLDLQLLGLGGNGHVGFMNPPAAPRPRAITLGTAEILAARELLLVVTGEAKAEILRRTLLEPHCPEVPASWLQRHPRLQVVVDRAAAAALSPG